MSICAHCGADFSCAMRDVKDAPSAEPCWCTELPPLQIDQMPAQSGNGTLGCLCPTCLRNWIAERAGA